jgi:hypothetical protein
MNGLYYQLKADKNWVREPVAFSFVHARNADGSPAVAAFRERTGVMPNTWTNTQQVVFYKDGTFHREVDKFGVYGPFGAGIESINPFAAAAHAVTDGIPGIIRKYALTQGMN